MRKFTFGNWRSHVSSRQNLCPSVDRDPPRRGTMRHLSNIAKWSAFILFLFAVSTTLHAQLNEGTIAGAVTDASGAAVAGASVKITNLQTGLGDETRTDNIGYYRVLHLQVGAYKIRVEAQGFKATVLDSIPVNVDTTTRADAKLVIGGAQETVEVAEGAALVQTEEARLSSTITHEEINNLPLNGRQVYQLVSLEPGVTQTNAPVISNVPSPTSSVTFDFGYTANGSTPRGNNFVLDGNSNNNEWLGGTPLIYPSLDAIQEVQVQTLNFSAEYGRNNGTVVSVITKSGTNDLHGTAFYSFRNTVLNARNFFDIPGDKTPLQQNQYGFSLGGPVIHDKAFFFVDYEGSRLKDGAPEKVVVETPYFLQNITLAPIAAMFFTDFPAPACSTPIPGTLYYCNAIARQIEHNAADQYLIRGDYYFSPRDQFYARWVNTLASGDVARQELLGAGIRGFTAPFNGFFADLGLGYTHEFSNSTLNDLRFAYSRNNSQIQFGIPSNTATAGVLKAAGLPPDDFADLAFDDGVVSMGGEVFVPRNFVFNTFAVTDTVTHTINRHTLKFGFDVRRIQENSDYRLYSNPFYEFSSIFAFAADAPYLSLATVNRTPGSPDIGQFTDTPRHFRWGQWAAFVQDDWKISSRLTLNAGLRYEVFGTPSETKGVLTNITLGSGSGIFQQIAAAKVGRVSQMWNTDYHNFAPRIGLAWDPTGKGTTVIR